jgi:hypothetical protein
MALRRAAPPPGRKVVSMLNRVYRKRFELHNRLLAALPGRDLQSLQPHLEAAPLARGRVLFEGGESLTRVHFVETGVVSLLTALENRATVGAATVGREGAVGIASLVLSGEHALGRYQVLVPGSALTMEVPAFRSCARSRSCAWRVRLTHDRSSSKCFRLSPAPGCTRWSSGVRAGC